MNEELKKLGFNEKEVRVYLALLEFGSQAASVIAKKTGYPKATVLFICDRLVKRGYVRRSPKGRTHYFYAEPKDLAEAKSAQIAQEKSALDKVVPLLNEFKNPFSSPPKLTFFEGLDGCRKAYSLLLNSTTEINEFGVHTDLLKLGENFMNDFIKKRRKKRIFLTAVCMRDEFHNSFQKRDKKDYRKIIMYPPSFGTLYSSIAVFENKILLLNLYRDAFGILIENSEVAETIRTIHKLARR